MAPSQDPEQGWRFCRTRDCDVVYFVPEGGARVLRDGVPITVFHKSDDPQRLACYCFGHSVASIEEEVRRTGDSLVPESVTEKCRAGLDRCEQTNPQGSCCLGNLRAVVNRARSGVELRVDPTDAPGCSCRSE